MSDLIYRTAADLAAAIGRREVSAVEVVEAHLQRIDALNGVLNAVVTRCDERAKRRAQEADAALQRGEWWGPLHGVPFTLKDSFDTEGVRTTVGHPQLADNVPDKNEPVVQRLLDAGAILLGKTNMPPFGRDFQTDNELFGRTNNPWDATRTPGGSSGGSAAAVASGMIPLDVGADLAGSVRVPAHYCGVFGLKPTEFLVPSGAMGQPRKTRHMLQAGPIARSAEDLRIALRLIAGPDPGKREVPPVPLHDVPYRPLSSYAIAWVAGFADAEPSPTIRAAVETLAADLGRVGCGMHNTLPDTWEAGPLMETWGELNFAEVGSGLDDDEREALAQTLGATPDSEDPRLRGMYRGLHADNRVYGNTLARRDCFGEELDRLLERVDFLLLPTSMTTAIPHWPSEQSIEVNGRKEHYKKVGLAYAIPFNLTGHPAVTCPSGLGDDGLPVGVQIVGKRWEDMSLLRFAERFSAFVGPIGHPEIGQ